MDDSGVRVMLTSTALLGSKQGEMITLADVRGGFVSKAVATLFPGNNNEHLQFDEESITSTRRG